jgi:hypothetical protein
MLEDRPEKMKINDEEDRESFRNVDPRQPFHAGEGKQDFPTVDRTNAYRSPELRDAGEFV